MENEITLRSSKEILVFALKNPELTFDQLNDIIYAYSGGHFTVVVMVPLKVPKEDWDMERPKRELLEWLSKYGEGLDSGDATHFFTSKFPKKESKSKF